MTSGQPGRTIDEQSEGSSVYSAEWWNRIRKVATVGFIATLAMWMWTFFVLCLGACQVVLQPIAGTDEVNQLIQIDSVMRRGLDDPLASIFVLSVSRQWFSYGLFLVHLMGAYLLLSATHYSTRTRIASATLIAAILLLCIATLALLARFSGQLVSLR